VPPRRPRRVRRSSSAATSTAFSLRAAGRAPISKARDRTAGSQVHDHAFRTPGPHAAAGPGSARAPAKFPVRRGTGRGKPRERAGPFPVRQRKTGNCGAAGRRRRAIPCSAGNNREFGRGR
jgi:hypothetical protein